MLQYSTKQQDKLAITWTFHLCSDHRKWVFTWVSVHIKAVYQKLYLESRVVTSMNWQIFSILLLAFEIGRTRQWVKTLMCRLLERNVIAGQYAANILETMNITAPHYSGESPGTFPANTAQMHQFHKYILCSNCVSENFDSSQNQVATTQDNGNNRTISVWVW